MSFLEGLDKLVLPIRPFVSTLFLFLAKTDLCVKLVEKHQFVAVIRLERFQLGENNTVVSLCPLKVSTSATGAPCKVNVVNTLGGDEGHMGGAAGRMEGERVKDIPGGGGA